MGKIAWPTIPKDAGLFWTRYKEFAGKDLPIINTTGVSSSTLSTWKTNKQYPRADVACKIAKTLSTTVEYLVTGEEAANLVFTSTALEIALILKKLNEEELNILKSVAVKVELSHNKEN